MNKLSKKLQNTERNKLHLRNVRSQLTIKEIIQGISFMFSWCWDNSMLHCHPMRTGNSGMAFEIQSGIGIRKINLRS